MKNKPSSKWVALDGIDAVGKSTQLDKLTTSIRAKGLEVSQITEFSDSELGNLIREIIRQRRFFALTQDRNTPMANMLTLLADLTYKVEQGISNSTKKADIYLSDRGILSFLAYEAVKIQYATRDSLEAVFLRVSDIIELATEKLPRADLHVIYRADLPEVSKRVVSRGESPLSLEQIDFLSSIQDLLTRPNATFPSSVIDVTSLSEDEVTDHTLKVIRAHLGDELS